MATLLDTCINHYTARELIRAFLHGYVQGEFDFYTKDDDTLAIKFHEDEDATLFKLKELDRVFENTFGDGAPEPEPAPTPTSVRKKRKAKKTSPQDDMVKEIWEKIGAQTPYREKKYGLGPND
jgi:hypothetical protein